MNTVRSDLMERHSLAPAMDAQVHNGDQALMIHNPSPSIDSLVELVAESARNTLHMARLLSDLAASNGLELDCEQMIAGFADDVTATLRHCERNTDDGPMSGRRLAAALKPMLDVLCDPTAAHKYALAVKALREIFRATPKAALFADTTTKHLNPRRARTLAAAHERWEQSR